MQERVVGPELVDARGEAAVADLGREEVGAVLGEQGPVGQPERARAGGSGGRRAGR